MGYCGALISIFIVLCTSAQPLFAYDEVEDQDYEVESSIAERHAVLNQADSTRKRLERKAAATRAWMSKTNQYIEKTRAEQARVEADIKNSERQIQQLIQAERKELARRQAAERALAAAKARLAKVTAELQAGKSLLAQQQKAAAQRESELAQANQKIGATQDELAVIKREVHRQKAAKKSAGPTVQLQRRSPASVPPSRADAPPAQTAQEDDSQIVSEILKSNGLETQSASAVRRKTSRP